MNISAYITRDPTLNIKLSVSPIGIEPLLDTEEDPARRLATCMLSLALYVYYAL